MGRGRYTYAETVRTTITRERVGKRAGTFGQKDDDERTRVITETPRCDWSMLGDDDDGLEKDDALAAASQVGKETWKASWIRESVMTRSRSCGVGCKRPLFFRTQKTQKLAFTVLHNAVLISTVGVSLRVFWL